MKNWLILMYIRLLTLLDNVGITPRGSKVFVVALILGIAVGYML